MALGKHHLKNFETLQNAFRDENIAIMECQRRSDGEIVALLCAINYGGGEAQFVPLAEMVNGNPYELYDPPNPEGGFSTQDVEEP